MHGRRTLAALLLAVLAGVAAPTASRADDLPAWRMDAAASQLTFTPRLAGGEFAGRFEHFQVALRFSPADLAHSSLQVTVDLPSARTGDADRDVALQGGDFFATSRWPRARFTSSSIRGLGGDRYEARGKLTLRDVTRDVVVPFRFEPGAPSGGKARLSGSTTVQRLTFNVGQGEWRSTDWLDDRVRIDYTVALDAAR
ncbi:MAG: YceI family protein [Gammaproteobacteria bacterium]|nr:YceI family protein [Gammaproteobacteria bacterium]